MGEFGDPPNKWPVAVSEDSAYAGHVAASIITIGIFDCGLKSIGNLPV